MIKTKARSSFRDRAFCLVDVITLSFAEPSRMTIQQSCDSHSLTYLQVILQASNSMVSFFILLLFVTLKAGDGQVSRQMYGDSGVHEIKSSLFIPSASISHSESVSFSVVYPVKILFGAPRLNFAQTIQSSKGYFYFFSEVFRLREVSILALVCKLQI